MLSVCMLHFILQCYKPLTPTCFSYSSSVFSVFLVCHKKKEEKCMHPTTAVKGQNVIMGIKYSRGFSYEKPVEIKPGEECHHEIFKLSPCPIRYKKTVELYPLECPVRVKTQAGETSKKTRGMFLEGTRFSLVADGDQVDAPGLSLLQQQPNNTSLCKLPVLLYATCIWVCVWRKREQGIQ